MEEVSLGKSCSRGRTWSLPSCICEPGTERCPERWDSAQTSNVPGKLGRLGHPGWVGVRRMRRVRWGGGRIL